MNKFGELIESSRKIVIKIGSNVLSDDEGHVNCNFISNIAEQIDDLCKLGKQIVIVSSGAGICGVGAIHKWSRRGDLNYKQALCAIGQVELMNSYKEYFSNVIYRFSLRDAIEQGFVKDVEYISKEDIPIDKNERWQVILNSHNQIAKRIPIELGIKPITIIVTSKQNLADSKANDFKKFLKPS